MAAKKDQQPTVNPDETVHEIQQDLMGAAEPAEEIAAPAEEPATASEGEPGLPVPSPDDTVQEFQQQDEQADTTLPVVRGEGVAELDKVRDYAQVFGKPGVVFEQDHKYFNFEGFEVKPELEA